MMFQGVTCSVPIANKKLQLSYMGACLIPKANFSSMVACSVTPKCWFAR